MLSVFLFDGGQTPKGREKNSPVFDETKNERLIERRDDGGDVCIMTSIL